MREILFRGKRIDNGEWVTGYYVRANYHWHKKGIHEDWIITGACSNGGWFALHGRYPVVSDTVGQYTGLNDRNGKRIFEGDIVRWASANTYLTSTYVYDRRVYGYGSVLIVTSLASGFTLRQIKDNAPDIPNANRKIDNYSFWNHQGQLEVIGNIHDNPELIGGKEDGKTRDENR